MNERRITVGKKYDTEGSNAQAKTKVSSCEKKIVETFIYCKLYNCINLIVSWMQHKQQVY